MINQAVVHLVAKAIALSHETVGGVVPDWTLYKSQAEIAINTLADLELKSQHPDDLAVDEFAQAMKEKLAKKRDDGFFGWWDKAECNTEFLGKKLREHVEKGDTIDVANFCMFLAARGERIPVDPSPSTNLRVKPLEWVKHPTADAWRCDTVFGFYQVWSGSVGTSWQFDGFSGDRKNETARDDENGRELAQAHYASAVLALLTPAQHASMHGQSARLWPGQTPETVIKEMIAVATGEYEGHEETLDPWTADNRAEIDRWQRIISDALATPSPQTRAVGKNNPHHDLYKTGDLDAPIEVKDRNGEVALDLCRNCGKGEIELCEPCGPIAAMTRNYTGCEYLGRDISRIEKIAKEDSLGATEVFYLYVGPKPEQE